jgi:Na+/melibiose symporter-like transporter
MTMTLWAAVCVVCFVITFATTRERIQPPPQQRSDARRDLKNLLANGPWIAMFVLTLAHFVFVAMRGGTMFYYFSYYVDQARLAEFIQRVGLPQATAAQPDGGHYVMNVLGLILNADHTNIASVGFSLFNIASQAVTVVGVILSTYLAKRFGKRAVALAGFSLTTIFLAGFVLLPAGSIGATFGLELVRALSYAPTIPLIWAMFADVADYAEWKTGRRTTGVVFATILFGLKTGLSLGGAIEGWLLSGYGYRANATQTEHALMGIRLTASVYPALCLCVVVGCLVFYRITRSVNEQMATELEQRRRSYGGVAAPGAIVGAEGSLAIVK